MQDSLRPTYFRPMLAVTAVAALLLMLAVVAQPVAAQDPPGNNTTVKIDGMPFDEGPGDDGPGSPDNEPHINACFAIDWYGFDMGEFYGTVTFQVWPPNSPPVEIDGTAIEVLHQPGDGHAVYGAHDQVVYIGEDSADGAGSPAGIDASIVYDLWPALSQYEAHPNQGYHVKISVENEGVRGAGAQKHKVVWVDGPCGGDSTSTPTTTPTESESVNTSTPTTTPSGGTGTVAGSSRRLTNTAVGFESQLVMILAGLLLAGSAATLGFDAVRRGRTTR